MQSTDVYPVERLLAVVEEPVQLPAGGQHLCARVDELEQVGPHLINHILPLGDRSRVRVLGTDQLVADVVDDGDALLTAALRLARKLLEAVAQHLAERYSDRICYITHGFYGNRIKHSMTFPRHFTLFLIMLGRQTQKINIFTKRKYIFFSN